MSDKPPVLVHPIQLNEQMMHNEFDGRLFCGDTPQIRTNDKGDIVAMSQCEVYPVGTLESRVAESAAKSYRKGLNDSALTFSILFLLLGAGLFCAWLASRR